MKTFKAVLIITLLASCGKQYRSQPPADHSKKESVSNEMRSSDSSPRFQAVSNAEAIERKLIRNGQITIKVGSVEKAKAEIDKACKDLKAYVSQEDQNNFGDQIQSRLTIRVPAENFDLLAKLVEGLGDKTDSKSVTVQDVTEEFIDTEARLKTKKDLAMRYREILHEARTVTDILAVESQINAAQAELESMEGRLKYLKDQVAFSSLTLTYYQTIGVNFGFGSKFVSAIKEGWDNLLAFIVGLVNLWPFLIMIGVGVWLFRRWRKRKKTAAA